MWKNWMYVLVVVVVSWGVPVVLGSIPGYLREPGPSHLVGWDFRYILTFLLFNVLVIGIPVWIHWRYVGDYSRLKSIWFFALFGGIVGGFFGEVALGASPLLMISYTLLMLIYGQFYRKFVWWKVAAWSYLAGVMVENVMNRSPIQIPTMMWIAFFTFPYFWAKIYENREGVVGRIWKDFWKTVVVGIVLAYGAYMMTRNNVSPPLIFLGALLPMVINILRLSLQKK